MSIDHPTSYAKDVFLHDLSLSSERTLAEHYIRWAGDVSDMSVDRFVEECPVLWDATLPQQSTEDQLESYYALHQRHADQVLNVWSRKYTEHKTEVAKGTLPEGCLLRLVPAERVRPVDRAARGIIDALGKGVPRVFHKVGPSNERAVQDAVDGILAAYEARFRREHPTIRFSTKGFTPDFSPALEELSVEIKFPTKTRKPTAIINEMSATAHAHRAARRSILFVIYDYHRLIANQDEIRRDMEASGDGLVFVSIIR